MENYQSRHNRHQRRKKRSMLNKVNALLLVIAIGLTVLIAYNVLKFKIGQFNNLNILVLAIMAIVVIALLFLVVTKRLKKFTTVLLVGYVALAGFGTWKLQEVIGLFSGFDRNGAYDEYRMSVVVLNDSGIDQLSQLEGAPLVAPVESDQENITKLIDAIQSERGQTFQTQSVASYYEAYTQLSNGTAKAIVLNSAYEGLIESNDSNYASKIKKIYEFSVRTPKSNTQVGTRTSPNLSKGVFNLYVSGIDTYGEITSVSRSDVNIIMTVNMNTHKVLLTTTPRDSYVPIADGGMNQYDKLTHAGIYGADASIHTLENLYGIEMDHYIRLNFTSFMNLVDTVGGVDVYNDYAFPSHNIPGYTFPAGPLHLDSKLALGYVRERYNLVDGDVGRAANQQEVITAILKKLASPRLLTNSSQIIQQLSGSMQTDMSLEGMMSIVNQQLGSGQEFTVESQALEVVGTMGLPSYAMPGANLYMGVVDETSLNTIKENIQSVLSGE